jgi:hypothetical protein
MKTTYWAILTFRYGRDVRNPTPYDIAEAVAELSNESISGMHEGDYTEHPNAWLRLGSDDGPVYLVDAYRNGQVILSKYADQDDIDAASEVRLADVPKEKLLAMWTCLARNDLAGFRAACSECEW